MSADLADAGSLVGRRVMLPGHFEGWVVVEGVRPLGAGYELRVRLTNGQLEEVVLSEVELRDLLTQPTTEPITAAPAEPKELRLLVESSRIRLAYAYDPHFAVSLSGIRPLPHQIEAVYVKMLPKPRLRFLLADDPGAGKTIMAGLLLKELKLREAIERILVLVPAALTIQWQDELLRFFGEPFEIITGAVDQEQLIDPWQRASQVIASLDYAKQEEVRERVWQQRWDLVIIDEAHKCSAYTKRGNARAPQVAKTKRYQLAERLTANADHVLLLTATPHHGDDDRFGHFLRLIDPDLFPEPHRLEEPARTIRRNILSLGADCPWALRRLKEDLRDLAGRRLFPDRHAHTVTFSLNAEEYALYKAVTAYINRYLPQSLGREKQSIALTRTVLQRRLASSTRAIHESLQRRLKRQRDLLKELERLSPKERIRRLEAHRRRFSDSESDEDDLDEAERDSLLDEYTAAREIEQLREEIAALADVTEQARRVREQAPDSKLAALRDCLAGAEFAELRDGRGKLVVFTEHRDTMQHLREHLERWGYSTCEIHGSMNPHERKRAQEDFRTRAQICVATEAAGEGINLQFCHLMINYDLPWNPTRLEQRLGRIHRIGQERDCHVFNFVAHQSQDGQPVIEGRILLRLLEKLEQMREALGHERVYDVIGEVLSVNEVNLAEMLREAAYDPRRLDDYLDQIDRIDPEKLRQYEQATGIALARSHVNFEAFKRVHLEAEERRLMPEYVARQFLAAANLIGLRVERRADGLWRVEHVPEDLRSERLAAVRRLGKPEASYRKLTFDKAHLEQDQHMDAVLIGPGHPLYAVVDEKLNQRLAALRGRCAFFTDQSADSPYCVHFFEMEIRGYSSRADDATTLLAELVAVREQNGQFTRLSPDVLHDLADLPSPPGPAPATDPAKAADFLKSTYQLEVRKRCQEDRRRFAEICENYLRCSFKARIRAAQNRVMQLRAREVAGETEAALARQSAERELADLKRTRDERMAGLGRLVIARAGPVRHIATAIVFPPGVGTWPAEADATSDPDSERAAMEVVMAFEQAHGYEPTDVSDQKIGFDIRSLGPPDPATGQRDVRRIEVKGRVRGAPIRLTTNEWLKARQLGPTYWLYVVWDPKTAGARPTIVRDPAHKLEYAAREIAAGCYWEIPGEAVARASETTEAEDLRQRH